MFKKALLAIVLATTTTFGAINLHLNREVQRLVFLIVEDQHLTQKEGFGADHLDRVHFILDLYVGLREYREQIKYTYPYIADHIDELERLYEILGRSI